MLVSSANKIILSKFDTSHMSFMYKINSTGSRFDPCGTPHLIFFSSELHCYNTHTDYNWLNKL